jgi:hypothetical protein
MLIDDVDVVTRIQVQAILCCLQAGVDYEAGRIGRNMRTITESLHLVQWHSPVPKRKYKNSTELKWINLFVSQNALTLIAGAREAFGAENVLEHPLPLDKMYLKLQEQRTLKLQEQLELTSENIVDVLGYWPLITVRSDEHAKLSDVDKQLKKLSRLTDPVERYEKAGIVVGRVKAIKFGTEPVWEPISLSDPSSWR